MEERPGWKPFKNIDPSMTETTLENAVDSMEAWLREVQNLKEGDDYVKRVAGAWTEIHVRESLYDALLQAYVAHLMDQAGGEAAFNERNAYKYPHSHGRGVRDVPALDLRPDRNPGKRDRHTRKD